MTTGLAVLMIYVRGKLTRKGKTTMKNEDQKQIEEMEKEYTRRLTQTCPYLKGTCDWWASCYKACACRCAESNLEVYNCAYLRR